MGGTGSRGIALIVRGQQHLFRDGDLGVVLQLLKAAVRDGIARIKALDFGLAPLTDSWLDVMDVRYVVLNQEHVGGVSIVLDRRGRDQNHVLQRVDQQVSVDKLVGKERAVFVVEERAQLQGSGGGIDL